MYNGVTMLNTLGVVSALLLLVVVCTHAVVKLEDCLVSKIKNERLRLLVVVSMWGGAFVLQYSYWVVLDILFLKQ